MATMQARRFSLILCKPFFFCRKKNLCSQLNLFQASPTGEVQSQAAMHVQVRCSRFHLVQMQDDPENPHMCPFYWDFSTVKLWLRKQFTAVIKPENIGAILNFDILQGSMLCDFKRHIHTESSRTLYKYSPLPSTTVHGYISC